MTLTASTGVGMHFAHWEVYDSNHPHDVNHAVIDGNNPLTIVMNADREIVAVYACGNDTILELMLLGIGGLAIAVAIRRR